jgi:hypothetical protein
MPRPRTYDSSAERARAWRERRARQLRDALAMRLRQADDDTLDRFVRILPMQALHRVHRALDAAEQGVRRHGRSPAGAGAGGPAKRDGVKGRRRARRA